MLGSEEGQIIYSGREMNELPVSRDDELNTEARTQHVLYMNSGQDESEHI